MYWDGEQQWSVWRNLTYCFIIILCSFRQNKLFDLSTLLCCGLVEPLLGDCCIPSASDGRFFCPGNKCWLNQLVMHTHHMHWVLKKTKDFCLSWRTGPGYNRWVKGLEAFCCPHQVVLLNIPKTGAKRPAKWGNHMKLTNLKDAFRGSPDFTGFHYFETGFIQAF